MRNNFYKKIFLGLVLIMAFVLISVGCMGVTPPPPPPPTTCTIIVTDQTGWILGNVYMDGAAVPSGGLTPWGSVQIDNVTIGFQHVIYIVNLWGVLSHSEFITPTVGTNYVHFYAF